MQEILEAQHTLTIMGLFKTPEPPVDLLSWTRRSHYPLACELQHTHQEHVRKLPGRKAKRLGKTAAKASATKVLISETSTTSSANNDDESSPNNDKSSSLGDEASPSDDGTSSSCDDTILSSDETSSVNDETSSTTDETPSPGQVSNPTPPWHYQKLPIRMVWGATPKKKRADKPAHKRRASKLSNTPDDEEQSSVMFSTRVDVRYYWENEPTTDVQYGREATRRLSGTQIWAIMPYGETLMGTT